MSVQKSDRVVRGRVVRGPSCPDTEVIIQYKLQQSLINAEPRLDAEPGSAKMLMTRPPVVNLYPGAIKSFNHEP